MSLAIIHAEDRRGIVLRAMNEDPAWQLNERSIRQVLKYFGHDIDAAMVRQLLDWLRQAGLLTVSRLTEGEELWLAKLTEAGHDVAGGRRHEGVRPFGR